MNRKNLYFKIKIFNRQLTLNRVVVIGGYSHFHMRSRQYRGHMAPLLHATYHVLYALIQGRSDISS